MYILNTTYAVDESVKKEWLQWVTGVLLPATLATRLLHSPKIYRVIVEQGQGPTYSVQFVANSADDIRNWRHQFRAEQDSQIRKMFGEKVLGFSTVLKEIV